MEEIYFKPGLYREFPRTVGVPRPIIARVPAAVVLIVGFIGSILVGFVFVFTAQGTLSFDQYSALMGFGVLFFIISGVLGIILILSGILAISERRHRTRLRRRPRWRRMVGTPQDQNVQLRQSAASDTTVDLDESRQWPEDVDRNIPDWLVPLLQNRSAARAIHEELVSSTQSPEEAESQLQSRIEELGTEIITIYQHRRAKDRVDEVLEPGRTSLLTEAEIEREAVLDLLGALELQYKDGKVSKGFYKRKRGQLLERLANADKELE